MRFHRRGRCGSFCILSQSAGTKAARHAEHVAAAVCIQAVITRVDGDVTACDIDGDRFNAFIAFTDEQNTVIDKDVGIGMDTIISGAQGDAAAVDGDITGCMNGISVGFDVDRAGFNVQVTVFFRDHQSVISGIDGEVRIHDAQTVVGVQPVQRCGDIDRPAGDDQVIVGVDTVLISADDGESACPVDGEVIMRIDCSIGPIRNGGVTEGFACGQEVFAAFRQSKEDLVRFLHPDGGVVG